MYALSVPLREIEHQLTQAAEMHLTDSLVEPLYYSLVVGALAQLPLPIAPSHVRVLAALKRWEENGLIDMAAMKKQSARII